MIDGVGWVELRFAVDDTSVYYLNHIMLSRRIVTT